MVVIFSFVEKGMILFYFIIYFALNTFLIFKIQMLWLWFRES